MRNFEKVMTISGPIKRKKWESRELPHSVKNNFEKLLILTSQTYEKNESEESPSWVFLLKTSNDYEA